MSAPKAGDRPLTWWQASKAWAVVIALVAAVGGFFYLNHRFPQWGLLDFFKGNGRTGNHSSCTMDSDCASGNCELSTTTGRRQCASSSVPLGDSCKRDDDCASGTCTANVCVKK